MRILLFAAAAISTCAGMAWAQPISDHLHCFKIKDSLAKATYTAVLTPGDASAPVAAGCQVKVPAKIMCIDVDAGNVTPPPPGAAPGTPARSYLCYKVKCSKVERVVAGTDQFGSHAITVKASNLVCAPLEAATTSTSSTSTSSTTTTSTSSSTTTTIVLAFRLTDLDLRDPHVFVDFTGCHDVTDTAIGGFSFNGELATRMNTDGDTDGNLDESLLALFIPFDESVAAGGSVVLASGQCTAPPETTSCTELPGPITYFTYVNGATSPCLTFDAGTVRPYAPAVTSPDTPCFAGGTTDLTLLLAGIPLTLRDAQVAATYVGNPATSLVGGLLRGFVTEADANATIIPASYPLIGGKPLSQLLPGGDPPGADNQNCSPTSDKDVHDGASGWWLYFNFAASLIDLAVTNEN